LSLSSHIVKLASLPLSSSTSIPIVVAIVVVVAIVIVTVSIVVVIVVLVVAVAVAVAAAHYLIFVFFLSLSSSIVRRLIVSSSVTSLSPLPTLKVDCCFLSRLNSAGARRPLRLQQRQRRRRHRCRRNATEMGFFRCIVRARTMSLQRKNTKVKTRRCSCMC
jgi:hypothetical protein